MPLIQKKPGTRSSQQHRKENLETFQVGVQEAELRVSATFLRGEAVLKNVWFDFDLSGKRVSVKSEEISRVNLREEHCWNERIEGNLQLRRREESKRQAEESVKFFAGT